MLDFCRLKIEGDIEGNEKKMITAKVINYLLSDFKNLHDIVRLRGEEENLHGVGTAESL